MDVIPTLELIRSGKIHSVWHEEYVKGSSRMRKKIQDQSNAICCIKPAQYEKVIQFLLARLCDKDKKMSSFSYTLNVLYPEGMVRVISKTFDMDRDQAMQVLHCLPFRNSCDDKTIDTEAEELDPFPLAGIVFPLYEIMEATNNKKLDNLLGCGQYGSVYKGFLRHAEVAVKFLNEKGVSALGKKHTRGDENAKTELATLAKLHHPNIVSVMGYSTNQDVVVYEYVAGGSLYDRLHEVTHGDDVLKWKDRLNILKDTCRGLVYLHAGIVHQDIKSQNILIDASNSAKLTDFGFAITLPDVREGRSLYTAKAFARSEGYYPSELTSGKFSAKSDMYSYGVVVLETFTAQKVFDSKRSDPKLVDHLEDELKTVTAFKQCQDCKAAECDEQWVTFLHKVVTETLARHSKRPTSLQVMESWESVLIT